MENWLLELKYRYAYNIVPSKEYDFVVHDLKTFRTINHRSKCPKCRVYTKWIDFYYMVCKECYQTLTVQEYETYFNY